MFSWYAQTQNGSTFAIELKNGETKVVPPEKLQDFFVEISALPVIQVVSSKTSFFKVENSYVRGYVLSGTKDVWERALVAYFVAKLEYAEGEKFNDNVCSLLDSFALNTNFEFAKETRHAVEKQISRALKINKIKKKVLIFSVVFFAIIVVTTILFNAIN